MAGCTEKIGIKNYLDMRAVEIYFVAEIKKNGVWHSTGIISVNLQEVNAKLTEYLLRHGSAESRIIQKLPKPDLKPKKRGCC